MNFAPCTARLTSQYLLFKPGLFKRGKENFPYGFLPGKDRPRNLFPGRFGPGRPFLQGRRRNNTALLAIRLRYGVAGLPRPGAGTYGRPTEVVSGGTRRPNWVVDFLNSKQSWPDPVTLREIKETGQFNGFNLVRMSRLSTITCA